MVNGVTTYFIYTDEGLIAELDEKGNIQVAYGWQPDTPWGTSPLWQANLTANQTLQTASYNYLITDYLGTPQLAINSKGQPTWKALSDAFGNSVADTSNQITINLRFPGQYYDQETGLHYNYFRDYNPKTGRYIQSDPIGIDGGINTFGYAAANPLYWTDSYGLALDTVSNWCRRNPLACMELGFGLLPRPLPEQFPKPISPENCPEEQTSPFPQPSFPPIFPSTDNGGNDQRGSSSSGNPAVGAAGGTPTPPNNNENDKNKKDKQNGKSSISSMEQEAKRGQAPRDVSRVDRGNSGTKTQDHVHFKDGTALNRDGTIHDAHKGVPKLSKDVRKWLIKHGWKLP